MFKILVSDPLAEAGVEILQREAQVDLRTGLKPDELCRILPGYDALIVRSETKVTAAVLAAGSNLRVVTRAGVGTDNIDVSAATERGVLVLNTPGPNAIAAAEHTLAMTLAVLRHVPRADASLHAGRWERKAFVGTELYHKTLGILGLGRIGREVALRARAFGADVVVYDPFITPASAEAIGARATTLNDVLAHADIVTLHLPLLPETTGIIGAAQLARMKRGAFLVNCARGGLVDEAALAEALASGRLAGAALDVFAHEPPVGSPLLDLPNVVVTPHLAASSVEAQLGVGIYAAETTLAALHGELVENAVNLPGLAPGALAVLQPWLLLADQLGQLLAGTLDGPAASVELGFLGTPREVNPALVGAAALRGFLSSAIPDQVTLINARLLAERRGIAVSERFAAAYDGQPLTLQLRVTAPSAENGEHAHTVAGTVDDAGHGKITALDGYGVELDTRGRLLFISHHDQPGRIGAVGTLLGERGINIAAMQVGRRQVRGHAVMIVTLDDALPRTVLEELRRIPGLSHAHYIDLGDTSAARPAKETEDA
jgi:D-3-phosphoglycerate dehydrogenase / 2-oxoglutarate reductase